jgi:hypothetical protein
MRQANAWTMYRLLRYVHKHIFFKLVFGKIRRSHYAEDDFRFIVIEIKKQSDPKK